MENIPVEIAQYEVDKLIKVIKGSPYYSHDQKITLEKDIQHLFNEVIEILGY